MKEVVLPAICFAWFARTLPWGKRGHSLHQPIPEAHVRSKICSCRLYIYPSQTHGDLEFFPVPLFISPPPGQWGVQSARLPAGPARKPRARDSLLHSNQTSVGFEVSCHQRARASLTLDRSPAYICTSWRQEVRQAA